FVPAIIACFVVIVASVLVTVVARRRLDRDRPLGVIPLTLMTMGLGLVVQIGLQVLFVTAGVFASPLG
ncbi:MAG: hypothetical protein LBC23_05655, partial [Coriobacteriales bacterium]|nr:hypothetical protein [Coriobacteriales bacterium]